MTEDQLRFQYHCNKDPELRFWLRTDFWTLIDPHHLTEKQILQAKAGIVTYPSGEVLCQFGSYRSMPDGAFFMNGPTYQDQHPTFHRKYVRNGAKGIQVRHGPSRSQQGDPRNQYSTTLTNLYHLPLRVIKFAPLQKTLLSYAEFPGQGYYSPTQFREWFRVPDAEGWIQPMESVCDPDNYGQGNGIWGYFLMDPEANLFIATVPLEHQPAD